jgi:asparagine synthase (glutamine-hydrolysing)
MCGILGYQGNVRIEDLSNLKSVLNHRGPDDKGDYFDDTNGVGLFHNRLSILDTSELGHQPMISDSGDVVLIFNGEIYNFQEIRESLTEQGYLFKSNSDTEVLLNLYLKKGENMFSELNGIFALAIWDKSKKRFLLARDALGVKPLYYSETENGFIFSSEIKALLHFSIKLGGLDYQALEHYLTFLWCPGEGTPFRKVRKLCPGEAIIVSNGIISKKWKWYELPVFRVFLNKRNKSPNTGVELFSKLRTAVHRQMISDVPVGCFLSGGLDSSTIVSIARDINPEIPCFTIKIEGGQEEGFSDDLPYAKSVAQHLNVPLDVVHINPSNIANDLEKMVHSLDEPLADPAALSVYYISKLAREQGIKVLLSGAGGDDLLTGYRRHHALELEKIYSWLPRFGKKIISQSSTLLSQKFHWGRRLAKFLGGAELDSNLRMINYFKWIQRSDLESLFSDEFRIALGESELDLPMINFLESLPPTSCRLEGMLGLEQRFFLADHNLNYTDKMSMAAGVEVRVPFLDLELVDYAATIPNNLKLNRGEGKWILKKAMEPYLPKEIIYRPKTGFGVPLRNWMRNELRDLTSDYLNEFTLKKRGLFDPKSVNRLIVENDSSRVDASYTLFSILCIEIWCQFFLDKNSDSIR